MTSKTKKATDWNEVIVWMMVYLGFFFMGLVAGMMLQQAIVKQGIIDVLSYTDIEVDINFNETKFMEELNNTFIPAWKQAINQTLNITTKCEKIPC